MLVLDGSVSPYLPPRELLEAPADELLADRGASELARMLRERLAHLHGVAPSRIALFPDHAAGMARLVRSRPGNYVAGYGPTLFDWSDLAPFSEPITIERSSRFRIERAQIEATPPGSTALVMTPNDPTGNAIGLTAVAQLAHRAGLLILDERSAEMQRRSMIPLVEEFESIALLRSFRDWAGLEEETPAYAITTDRIVAAVDASEELAIPGLLSALAVIRHASKLDAIAHRVRLERLRLYRMLRKLNLLTPFPSDAGYVLAAVTRGDRDQIHEALRERGIAAFAPQHPRLAHTLRFAAVSPAATTRLQHALVDISRTVLDRS